MNESSVKEQALSKKYDDFYKAVCDDSEKALCALIQSELELERADSPVKNKRRLMFEMYPHLKKLCLGDIGVFLTAIDNPAKLYSME